MQYGSEPQVRVFFHTSAPIDVPVAADETVSTLREKLLEKFDRPTEDLDAMVNGQFVFAADEPEYPLNMGDSVVFSGSVKGG